MSVLSQLAYRSNKPVHACAIAEGTVHGTFGPGMRGDQIRSIHPLPFASWMLAKQKQKHRMCCARARAAWSGVEGNEAEQSTASRSITAALTYPRHVLRLLGPAALDLRIGLCYPLRLAIRATYWGTASQLDVPKLLINVTLPTRVVFRSTDGSSIDARMDH